MLINVNICVYNTRRVWLEEAVHSVLSQTYKDLKLIIVDDGSTSLETVQYLESLCASSIKILRHAENRGLPSARNTFLSNLDEDCEFIALLDSDDAMDVNRIELQVRAMRDCNVDILGTQIYGDIQTDHPLDITDQVFRTSLWFINNPSIMVRREVFDNVGNYSTEEEHRYVEDYELLTRCYVHGHVIKNLPLALTYYRVHDGQITHNEAKGSGKLLRRLRRDALREIRKKKIMCNLKRLLRCIHR